VHGVKEFLLGFGNRVSGFGLVAAAAGLVVVVAINGVNVVARYVFRSPFSWAEEAMLYTIIGSVSWGASAVAWRQLDICIDAFVGLATGPLRVLLRIIASLISIIIMFSLFFVGGKVAMSMYSFNQVSDALRLPMWIPHSVFTFGLLLTALMMAARLLVSVLPADHNSPDRSD
jgi:C4-dicarboxylate transporter DctQ subunit